jgi:hypothetical protein
MNGTRIRAAVALTCIAALAAPGGALAAKKSKRGKSAKPNITKRAKSAPAQVTPLVLKRDFDAGGNGAGKVIPAPGVRVDLGIDLVGLTAAIPNELLVELGLPPTPVGQLPTIPPLPIY